MTKSLPNDADHVGRNARSHAFARVTGGQSPEKKNNFRLRMLLSSTLCEGVTASFEKNSASS
jgi:hypothetical protein